jgi:hypothetical protein
MSELPHRIADIVYELYSALILYTDVIGTVPAFVPTWKTSSQPWSLDAVTGRS